MLSPLVINREVMKTIKRLLQDPELLFNIVIVSGLTVFGVILINSIELWRAMN